MPRERQISATDKLLLISTSVARKPIRCQRPADYARDPRGRNTDPRRHSLSAEWARGAHGSFRKTLSSSTTMETV
jgi:hypothetical protein